MSYWKLLGITLGVVLLDCLLGFALALMLLKFELISVESFIGFLLIFIALGMMILSIYNYKKGVIFSWRALYLFYKPSREFYLKFWFQLMIISAMFLIGLYSVIASYF